MEKPFELISDKLTSVVSAVSLLFGRNQGLMGKSAIELLSNPETRDEFIEFTSPHHDDNQVERKKTFATKDGSVTIVTYS